MTGLLLPPPIDRDAQDTGAWLTPGQATLRQMVLDAVTSPSTRHSYGRALDGLFGFSAGRPLTRALLQEWKASMGELSASTVNVRLSAARKLVEEARRNGMLGAEEAANLTDVPNVRQQGTRLGNWLTREQARELLQVPDRSTLKGKRDHMILAVLVGCALRRDELATLEVDTLQLREGRWVLADLVGKGGPGPHRRRAGVGQAGDPRLDDRGWDRRGPPAPAHPQGRQGGDKPVSRARRFTASTFATEGRSRHTLFPALLQ